MNKEIVSGASMDSSLLSAAGGSTGGRGKLVYDRRGIEGLETTALPEESLVIDEREIRHALLVGTRFRVRASDVTGCLVLVLGVTSLARFVESVEAWAERSAGG